MLPIGDAKLLTKRVGDRVQCTIRVVVGSTQEVSALEWSPRLEADITQRLRWHLWQTCYAEIFALVPRLCRAARAGARTEGEVAEVTELSTQLNQLSRPGPVDLQATIRCYSQLLLDLIREHPELGLSSRMELVELNRAVQ